MKSKALSWLRCARSTRLDDCTLIVTLHSESESHQYSIGCATRQRCRFLFALAAASAPFWRSLSAVNGDGRCAHISSGVFFTCSDKESREPTCSLSLFRTRWQLQHSATSLSLLNENDFLYVAYTELSQTRTSTPHKTHTSRASTVA